MSVWFDDIWHFIFLFMDASHQGHPKDYVVRVYSQEQMNFFSKSLTMEMDNPVTSPITFATKTLSVWRSNDIWHSWTWWSMTLFSWGKGRDGISCTFYSSKASRIQFNSIQFNLLSLSIDLTFSNNHNYHFAGTVFGIPSLVMGYTLLAIGTSLPDAVASGIVSQHGKRSHSNLAGNYRPFRCHSSKV